MYEKIRGIKEVKMLALSTRKNAWIAKLIKEIRHDAILSESLKSQRDEVLNSKIAEDTDVRRVNGKAYSSIYGALKVWSNRYGA